MPLALSDAFADARLGIQQPGFSPQRRGIPRLHRSFHGKRGHAQGVRQVQGRCLRHGSINRDGFTSGDHGMIRLAIFAIQFADMPKCVRQ